ncbi:hypothetical protein [Marinimicrobium sp. LS-A18]|uniref:hypothetical protein n=1 Tax=Marinimicrobium sp. LS-A18 TaxID=1381596 RepID=UPI0004655337|nr:hypothetical protein [Marinimicrobium sp. LS-A18]
MEWIKWAGWIFGALFLIGFVLMAGLFFCMAFQGKLTEIVVRRMKDFVLEDACFRLAEDKSHAYPPLPREYQPGSGDVAGAREVLLTPSGTLEEGKRVYDSSSNCTVRLLEPTDDVQGKVFHRNDVFALEGARIGRTLHSFSEPRLSYTGYVGGVSRHWFVLEGNPENTMGVRSKLWQVSHADYSRVLLSESPYYSFSRPPRTFRPDGFNGVVLVYYVGSVDYGFGGDCSRPKYSVIRLYSDRYPEGHDVARLSFRAGTIVDVRYEQEALVLYGDPTRPGESPSRRPRVWHLQAI